MGTLGKAAGVGGAFVAAHETVIETLIQKARPYIFTTATPPALAHALLTSLDLLEGEEGVARRAHLQALVAQLDDGLRLERWQRLPSKTAIQPILIGDNAETMRAGAALYEQGLWVGAIRPPTVAAGTARLRVTLSAAHNSMDVAKLIGALNAWKGYEMSLDDPVLAVAPQTQPRQQQRHPAALQLLRHRHRYGNRQDLISSAMLHALVHAACAPAA
jgi:8-amino-7-oxononanoate synthase